MRKTKIAFLIDKPILSGGIYVIFEHAIRMNRAEDVCVHLIMENELNTNDLNWHPEAKELTWLTYQESQELVFDAVVATWWKTCYELYRIKSKSYFYFNQSIESFFYKDQDVLLKTYADSTYMLGLNIITEATWIKKYIKYNYGIEAQLVRNGIRKDIYTTDGPYPYKKVKGNLRVLVEGPLGVFYKNTEKAIELALKSKADEVWLLTSTEIREYKNVDKVFSKISIWETPNIYRSCDIVLKLSYVEGMFGPPLEMFHCGGTAIIYDVTGHDEYIINNFNSLVIKTNDEQQVIDKINFLKENPDELERLKQGAIQTAKDWHNWDIASDKFMNAIFSAINNNFNNQLNLENKTALIQQWYKMSLYVNNNKYKAILWSFIWSIPRKILKILRK